MTDGANNKGDQKGQTNPMRTTKKKKRTNKFTTGSKASTHPQMSNQTPLTNPPSAKINHTRVGKTEVSTKDFGNTKKRRRYTR